jgi:hypothetical protein
MPTIGLLWRQEWDPPRQDVSAYRLHGVFDAFAALGVEAEPVIYGDDRVDKVRRRVVRLDGVLVWVNPIEQGLDRTRLDALLRDAAHEGVWVSAHPDVITRLATKRVLYDTRSLGWGTDTRLYRTRDELREGLSSELVAGAARVLKRRRGMGGQGVVGFAHQYPAGLRPAGAGEPPPGKRFEQAAAVEFRRLRERVEGEWLPELRRLLELERAALPVIWDIDFLYGPKTAHGEDTFVLCEINASSTFAFPEHAMPGVAAAALEAVGSRR